MIDGNLEADMQRAEAAMKCCDRPTPPDSKLHIEDPELLEPRGVFIVLFIPNLISHLRNNPIVNS